MYLGDFVAGQTIYFKWGTVVDGSGSVTRATNGTIRIYKNGSDVQRSSANGVTDTEDFDSLTGFHHLSIDLADNTDAGFYAAGSDYMVMVTGMVIGGLTLNVPLCSFSIENRNDKADVREYGGSAGTFASGRPEVNLTHIAGSAVSASTAQLGVNVVNFGGAAGTFSGGRPEVNTTHAAGTAWGSGAITAASIASNAIAAAKIASGAITSAKFAAGAIDATAIADNAIDAGAIATGALTAAKFAAGAIDAAALAADAGTEIATAVWASGTRVLTANTNLNDPTAAAIADAVWDELQADHVGAGSFGLIASEIADILVDTAEIGAAGAGLTNINLPDQTMNITGDITGNLSGSVGSVTGAVGSVTGLTAADVGAIKTVTDKLDDTLEDDAGTFRFTTNSLEQAPTGGSAPSAADIRAEIDANSTQLAAIVEDTGTTLDGKINAIKAKTDSLTFTVANQVDSNIKSVAGTTVTGSGTAGDPWGP